MPDLQHVVVTAAVIERDGAFLVTRRLEGTHLEGYWEFPGGKCDPGEPLEACLEREIFEELGAPSRIGAEVFSVAHAYPDRIIELHFFACELLDEPLPLMGQEMKWARRQELRDLKFPPADADLITLLENHEP